jgi:hypothetical protein
MKFIIMLFSPRSVFLPFRSKYPQHPVLKNPQSVFLPQSERPSFAPIIICFPKIRISVTLQFLSPYFKWTFSKMFPHESSACHPFLLILVICPAHLRRQILCLTLLGNLHQVHCSLVSNFLNSPHPSFFLGPNIFLAAFL